MQMLQSRDEQCQQTRLVTSSQSTSVLSVCLSVCTSQPVDMSKQDKRGPPCVLCESLWSPRALTRNNCASTRVADPELLVQVLGTLPYQAIMPKEAEPLTVGSRPSGFLDAQESLSQIWTGT